QHVALIALDLDGRGLARVAGPPLGLLPGDAGQFARRHRRAGGADVDVSAPVLLALAGRLDDGEPRDQPRAGRPHQPAPLLEKVPELEVEDRQVPGYLAADDADAGRRLAGEPGPNLGLGRQPLLEGVPAGELRGLAAVAPDGD